MRGTGLPKCKHVVRVLLIGVYSGTRQGATNRFRWIPSIDGGWIDLKSETMHRAGSGQIETNKRQTRARIHRRLLPWLRRWYRQDMVEG